VGEPVHVEWRPRASVLRSLTGCLVRTLRAFPFLRGSCLRSAIRRRTTATEAAKEAVPVSEIEFCIAAANAFARDGHNVLVYSPQRSQIDPLVREFSICTSKAILPTLRRPPLRSLSRHSPSAVSGSGETCGSGGAEDWCRHASRRAASPVSERDRRPARPETPPVVVASPTLAQGVDLSCSVLLFRALTRFRSRNEETKLIIPAEFANVVGRAGRAYVDLDGIVTLQALNPAGRGTIATSSSRH